MPLTPRSGPSSSPSPASAAKAIQRAVLFEQQHRVATILQRAILPRRAAQPRRSRFAARYLPAEEGGRGGGDWHDAFRAARTAPSGPPVGDVEGTGCRPPQ